MRKTITDKIMDCAPIAVVVIGIAIGAYCTVKDIEKHRRQREELKQSLVELQAKVEELRRYATECNAESQKLLRETENLRKYTERRK